MENQTWITAIAAAFLTLTACSEAPKPAATEKSAAVETKKEPPKPPEPVTGQTAFYEMYKPARTWATDLLPLSLASGEIASLKNEGGKAAMWTAVFVSPSRHEARTFHYAAVDNGEQISKGVSAGGAEPWSGATAKSKPFQTQDFLINSDAAYNTAVEKAGAWLKEHPDMKPAFFLGSSAQFQRPVWLVIWGTTKSGYAAYIDATTGTVNPH